MNLTWFMANVKSNPKVILRQAQDDGLKMLKNKIMVRLRRELSRTLVEPLVLNFDIHLTFACLPQAGILKFRFKKLCFEFRLPSPKRLAFAEASAQAGYAQAGASNLEFSFL